MDEPVLSVVIPTFNEAAAIAEVVGAVKRFAHEQRLACEVLVGDDGSTDAMADIVERLSRQYPGLRLLRGDHRGKVRLARDAWRSLRELVAIRLNAWAG